MAQEEFINDQETAEQEHGYQIIITNIKYGRELFSKIKDRPDMTVLDVPEGILKTSGDTQKFMDNVESFAYNTVTRKYGAEVSHCQIWLPDDDPKSFI